MPYLTLIEKRTATTKQYPATKRNGPILGHVHAYLLTNLSRTHAGQVDNNFLFGLAAKTWIDTMNKI